MSKRTALTGGGGAEVVAEDGEEEDEQQTGREGVKVDDEMRDAIGSVVIDPLPFLLIDLWRVDEGAIDEGRRALLGRRAFR